MTSPDHPPFSRPFAISELRDTGHEIVITAKADERAALALVDGLVCISSLEADFRIIRRGRIGLHVTGQVRAHITQTCVVSLEPFDALVNEVIDVRYAIKRRDAPDPLDIAFDVADSDPPEPLVDGRVDLGALAAEFLALALDPYPRKPGAVLAAVTAVVEVPKNLAFVDLKAQLEKKGNKN